MTLILCCQTKSCIILDEKFDEAVEIVKNEYLNACHVEHLKTAS